MTSEALPRANHVQGYPKSAELWQIPGTKSLDIDIAPSRLRSRLIFGFELQLMIERLLAAVLVILRSSLLRFFGSAKYSEPSGFIKLAEPGDHSLPRPGRRSIRFDERPVRCALTILILEVLANKHSRACYRVILGPPERFFSLHRV